MSMERSAAEGLNQVTRAVADNDAGFLRQVAQLHLDQSRLFYKDIFLSFRPPGFPTLLFNKELSALVFCL